MKKLICILLIFVFVLAGCDDTPASLSGAANEGIFLYSVGTDFGINPIFRCYLITPEKVTVWTDTKYPDIKDGEYVINSGRSASFTDEKFSSLCKMLDSEGFYALSEKTENTQVTEGSCQHITVLLPGSESVTRGGYMACEVEEFGRIFRALVKAAEEPEKWEYFPDGDSSLVASVDGNRIELFLDYNAPNVDKVLVEKPFERMYELAYAPIEVYGSDKTIEFALAWNPDETPSGLTLTRYLLSDVGFGAVRTAPDDIPVGLSDGTEPDTALTQYLFMSDGNGTARAKIPFETKEGNTLYGYRLSYTLGDGRYTYDWYFVLAASPYDAPLLLDGFFDGAEAVEIKHTVGLREETGYAWQGDILTLKNWADGLKYTLCDDADVPTDVTGNEVYEFLCSGRRFSYVDYGGEECFLLSHDGTWYKVLNPSDPPEQTFFNNPADEPISIMNRDGALEISVSEIPIVEYSREGGEKAKADNSDGKVFATIARLLDGKKAVDAYTDCLVDYRIYVSGESASYRYEFALHSDCGSVAVTNNGVLVGTVTLSDGEVDELLGALKERTDEVTDRRDKYFRTGSPDHSAVYPSVAVVNSKKELEERLLAGLGEAYDIDAVAGLYETDSALVRALRGYDDGFFSENSLIVLFLSEESGSARHVVTSVRDGAVTVKRLVPLVGTCDEALWTLIIEQSKDETALTYSVDIVSEPVDEVVELMDTEEIIRKWGSA